MITINGNAKINLTLDILGKRTDGYHEVSMIMQSINLFDTLTLQKLDEQKIILHGDVRGVARMQDNLIYKAAQLFLDTYKIHSGVEINLTKRIFSFSSHLFLIVSYFACKREQNKTRNLISFYNTASLPRSFFALSF